MKKMIALLLAAVMLLTITACGSSAEPVETAPATTEAPTEAPTEATTTIIMGAEECLDALLSLGYIELNPDIYAQTMEKFYGDTDAAVTPVSMEITQDGFVMELDCMQYFERFREARQAAPWKAYGTKGDELGVFLDLESQGYKLDYVSDLSGTDAASQIVRYADYYYYRWTESGKVEAEAYVSAAYYPGSGNLYNVLQEYTEPPTESTTALVFARTANEYLGANTVETIQYGDFSFELHTFGLQYGEKVNFYQYRPGMSLSDWACSELNTDGWIPWYGDTVLSPDRAYIADTGYLDMRDMMGVFPNPDNIIVAEEYDGKTNRLNNGYTTAEISGPDLSGMDMSGATVISGDALQQFLEQNGLDGMSIEELQDFFSNAKPEDLDMTGVSQDSFAGGISSDGEIFAGETEAEEIAKLGNISVSVAHMVNAKTPLFTPGFRIVSKEDGRVAYHSVEIGGGLYLLDDTLDIYMNGIADELIPYIKLYAFPESEEFMATLEGHTILNAHTAPLEQGDAMLTIPEDAVCLTFQRVPDGQEAPNSPSHLAIPTGMQNGILHGNLNKDAVYARYVTKDDPNFGEGVNLVFAITFDDELVYWIHMGANFNETVEVTRATYDMPY